MRTNTRVHFGLYDVTARGDSSPASEQAQPFCDLERDLLAESVPALTKYGTLEKRQFLMDGSFVLFPDDPAPEYWGLWSMTQSGSDGRFAEPPILEITFTQEHSSAGLTLHFYEPTGDWASDVLIQWYGPNEELLGTGRFAPDAVDYYCAKKVEGYRRVKITFLATSRPGRYLKLSALDYGVSMTFSGKEVVTAHVLESIDPLSNELSINTLDLTLFNGSGAFSILNPNGVFDVLQHKQKFTVYEDVRQDDGQTVAHNMGTFYLSDWENSSDTLANFTATDAVGLLDSAPHEGGLYDTTAAQLAADILAGYDYELEEALRGVTVRGYLPSKTRRDALQQLAFALGAVVDCSRSDKIRIYRAPTRPSSLITYRRKWMGSKVTLRPLITGVEVTAHQYLAETEESELFRDTLTPGEHKVSFSSPCSVTGCTGAELLSHGVNSAVVKVEQSGEVIVTGHKYQDQQTVVTRQASDLPPNVQDNVLQVTGATLVGTHNAAEIAAHILNYYAGRYEQNFTMLAGTEVLADMVVVESFGGEKVRGDIEQMEFDLTGGFVADTLVVGRRLNTTAEAYAGEIRAGERSLI